MTITQLLILGKKFKAVADGIYALSALFVVPCIIVMPVLWWLEKPSIVRAHVNARPLHGGELQELSGGIDFQVKPLRVAYHLELVGDGGTVFQFPQVETKEPPKFDSLLLPIPSTVKPGSYRLVAKLQYAVNPIKSVSDEIKVTTVTVD